MKLELQEKWFEIGKIDDLETQNQFLEDALILERSRPLRDLNFYLALVSIIVILSINSLNLASKIVLIFLWLYLIYSMLIFNRNYDIFKKRWFK